MGDPSRPAGARILACGAFDVGGLAQTAKGPIFAYAPRWLATSGAHAASVLLPLTPGAQSGDAVAAWTRVGGGAERVAACGALRWRDARNVEPTPGRRAACREPEGRPGWVDAGAFGLSLAALCGLRAPADVAIEGSAADGRTLTSPRPDRSAEGHTPLHAERWSDVAAAEGRPEDWIAGLVGRIDARETLAALDHLALAALLGDDRFSPDRFHLILVGAPTLGAPCEIGGVGPWRSEEGATASGLALDAALGGGVARADRLTAEAWRGFANRAGLNGTFMVERVGALIERARTHTLEAERRAAARPGARSALVDYFRRRADDRLDEAATAIGL